MDRLRRKRFIYLDELHNLLEADDVEQIKSLYIGNGEPNSGNWVTENVVIDRKSGANLLHLAVPHMSLKVMETLVNSPYGWSPDKAFEYGGTALNYAVKGDNIATLFILGPKSQEKRGASEGHQANRTLAEHVLWPQTYWLIPFTRTELFYRRERADVTEADRFEERNSKKYHLLEHTWYIKWGGCELALIIELMMAAPKHFQFNPWTGEEIDSIRVGGKFWPIPALSELQKLDEWHEVHCMKYPTCLSEALPQGQPRHIEGSMYEISYVSPEDQLQAVRRMSRTWLAHELCHNVNGVTVMRPPSLKRFVRASFRMCLTITTDPQYGTELKPNVRENYFRLVDQLPINPSAKRFLEYSEFQYGWDYGVIKLISCIGGATGPSDDE